MEILIYVLLSSIITYIVGYFINNKLLKYKVEKIIDEAKKDGEIIKKEKILQAKEKFIELKKEYEFKIRKKNDDINRRENRLRNRETEFNNKEKDLKKTYNETKQGQIKNKKRKQILDKLIQETETEKENLINELETITGLTKEQAKEQLIKELKDQAKMDAMSYIKETIEETKISANKEATKIIVQTIQRIAAEKTIENCISTFPLEDESLKGKIIGREGRNIRTLEAATGVEIIVDDTPDAIVISCFDPVRREVANQALKILLTDGRIHPARIEEVVKKIEKQIEEEIVNTGKKTIIDLGVQGLHFELVRMVGRMKYRSSYGQNLLSHSREVANLCANMASELGLDVQSAKRAGLLHDIGKVYDQETDLPHAIVGMKLAEKYKEKEKVCNAIGAHHNEVEMTDIISPIIQACDAISGARPGARREVTESYIKRLKELEEISSKYDGVQKTFAIQAGRELRVIVDSDKISDNEADNISLEISKKIQEEMVYPGQIKVMVIREKRSVSIAK